MSSENITRNTAKRVFARELNDAEHQFKESDDERAPNWSLLPTGEKANRIFIAGTLTETTNVGNDSEYWRGRIVDGSGEKFYIYAGQYQPDAMAFLRQTDPPAYVTVVGKPSTYTNNDEDDDNVYVSVRPEEIQIVEEETRNNWIIETANHTLARVQRFAEAREDGGLTPLMEDAIAEYGGELEVYRDAAVEALESTGTVVE